MSFRRSKSEAKTTHDWREFATSNANFFDEAGLPWILQNDRDSFESFLMHGFLAMPGGLHDGIRFSTDALNVAQWRALDKLVALYVAEFDDPGVSLGPRPKPAHSDDQ
jgi:hypothetical protein